MDELARLASAPTERHFIYIFNLNFFLAPTFSLTIPPPAPAQVRDDHQLAAGGISSCKKTHFAGWQRAPDREGLACATLTCYLRDLILK